MGYGAGGRITSGGTYGRRKQDAGRKDFVAAVGCELGKFGDALAAAEDEEAGQQGPQDEDGRHGARVEKEKFLSGERLGGECR